MLFDNDVKRLDPKMLWASSNDQYTLVNLTELSESELSQIYTKGNSTKKRLNFKGNISKIGDTIH